MAQDTLEKKTTSEAGKIVQLTVLSTDPTRHTADGQGMREEQAWQALVAGKGLAAAIDAPEVWYVVRG